APEGSVSGAGPRDTLIVRSRCTAGSSLTPLKNSVYSSAIRAGVCLRPGRSGSSPIASSSSRVSCSTRSLSTAMSGGRRAGRSAGGLGVRRTCRLARGLRLGGDGLLLAHGHLDGRQRRDRTVLAGEPLRALGQLAHVAEDLGDLVVVERLLLEQSQGEAVEHVAVLGEHLVRLVVRLFDERAHLLVDGLG